MASAQRNGGADTTPQREEKRTEITVGMNRDTPTTQRTHTQTQDKYVSVSTGVLLYLTHVQLFSQNHSLFSSISNQIIIQRMIEE